MKRFLLLLFSLALAITCYGATPQVPSKMQFANIRLHITADAKRRIQEKVDSLTRSEAYFQSLLDRANLYLPIIERVLKEENLPLDFRYLIIQESAFVSDAISSANAVGFWQFKAPAAKEVGLKMNQYVDERMHITAATQAAAMYLKLNNQEFDNWLYALLAYNEGRTGAKRFVEKKYRGASAMKVDGKAHIYIIHFLAYKVAFERLLGKERHPELYLHEYQKGHGKTLDEIAQELNVDKQQVKEYNKWLKRYRVPHDATCAAIIPMTHQQYARHGSSIKTTLPAKQNIDYAKYWEQGERFPAIATKENKKTDATFTEINGLVGTLAEQGDNLAAMAKAGTVSLAQFLAFNDVDKDHQVVPGQVYYYGAKWSKAATHYHITRPGETWWAIAQKYGIKKEALLLKNRLRQEEELKAGRVLWLRFIRPAKVPVAYALKANE